MKIKDINKKTIILIVIPIILLTIILTSVMGNKKFKHGDEVKSRDYFLYYSAYAFPFDIYQHKNKDIYVVLDPSKHYSLSTTESIDKFDKEIKPISVGDRSTKVIDILGKPHFTETLDRNGLPTYMYIIIDTKDISDSTVYCFDIDKDNIITKIYKDSLFSF